MQDRFHLFQERPPGVALEEEALEVDGDERNPEDDRHDDDAERRETQSGPRYGPEPVHGIFVLTETMEAASAIARKMVTMISVDGTSWTRLSSCLFQFLGRSIGHLATVR